MGHGKLCANELLIDLARRECVGIPLISRESPRNEWGTGLLFTGLLLWVGSIVAGEGELAGAGVIH